MLINKANLDELFFNLKATYDRHWEDTEAQWPKIAMLVASMSARNEYKWLSKFPRMREWIGEKTIKQFEGSAYTIVNKDWEATVEVDRNDIEDDMLSIYAPQAQMAGYSAKRFPDEIVFSLVNNGFANKGYDNKTFFATNHRVGKNNVSNKGTKALAGDTLANAKASFGAARTALLKQTDEDGRPLGVMPNVLLVPSALIRHGDGADDGGAARGRQGQHLQGRGGSAALAVADVGHGLVPAGYHAARQAVHLPGAHQARLRAADGHGFRLGVPAQAVPLRGGVPRQRRLRLLADGLRLGRHDLDRDGPADRSP